MLTGNIWSTIALRQVDQKEDPVSCVVIVFGAVLRRKKVYSFIG